MTVNTVSEVQTTQKEPEHERRIFASRPTQVLWLLLIVFEAFLALRFVLKLKGAKRPARLPRFFMFSPALCGCGCSSFDRDTRRRSYTMEALNWKLRFAVLWLVAAEAVSAHMINVTIDPVSMKIMLEWGATIPAAGWLFGAIYWLIPLWMAFVTVAVKGPSNRWANFVAGHNRYASRHLPFLHVRRACVFCTAGSRARANCSSHPAFGYGACGYGTDYLVCMEVAQTRSVSHQLIPRKEKSPCIAIEKTSPSFIRPALPMAVN